MTDIAPGQVLLDRYVIEKRLGMGSFGTVWLADDRVSGFKIALKVLHPRFAAASMARVRFEREARVLLDMQHPGIAGAKSFHHEGDLMCFALELVPGRTLDVAMGDRTKAGKSFSIEEVRLVLDQLSSALGHAHELGVIHRDLKPSNVMVDDALALKILDFGLLKLVDAEVHEATTRGRQIGSMLYMSPEQIVGDPTEAPSDVFAVGSMVFELLTLRRAWAVDEAGIAVPAFDRPVRSTKSNAPTEVFARITSGPRPRASDFRLDLPLGMDSIIERALAISPRDRYPTVMAMKDAVDAAFGGSIPRAVTAATAFAPIPNAVTLPTAVPATAVVQMMGAQTTDLGPAIAERGPRVKKAPIVVLALGAAALAAVALIMPDRDAGVSVRSVPLAVPSLSPSLEPHAVRAAPAPVTPAPVAAPVGSPSPTRAHVARPIAAPRPTAAASPAPSPAPYARLWGLMRDARARSDPATISQLGEAISSAATADVADPARRQKIQRLAQSSSLIGDLNGLELALTLLSQPR